MPMKKIAVNKELSSAPICKLICGDKRTQVIRFSIPRKEGGVDLSTLLWTVEVINANNNKEVVYLGSATLFDTHLHVDWTVGALATAVTGTTIFKLKGLDSTNSTTIVWQSADRYIEVQESKVDVQETTTFTESQTSSAQTYLVQITGKLASLTSQVNALEAKIPNLNSAVTQANSLISQVQTTLTTAQTASATATAAAADAEEASELVGDALSQLDSALAVSQQATANAEIATMNATTAATNANSAKESALAAAQSANTAASGLTGVIMNANYAAQDAKDIYQALQGAVARHEFDGQDGYSPTFSYEETEDGYLIHVLDKNGYHDFELKNGKDYIFTEDDLNYILSLVNVNDKASISALNAEIQRATTAEESLNSLITSEKNRAQLAESSLQSSISTKIAELVASAPEAFDTLKEIADWIGSGDVEQTTAASMLADITELKSKVQERFTVESPLIFENDKISLDMTSTSEINTMMAGW